MLCARTIIIISYYDKQAVWRYKSEGYLEQYVRVEQSEQSKSRGNAVTLPSQASKQYLMYAGLRCINETPYNSRKFIHYADAHQQDKMSRRLLRCSISNWLPRAYQ